MNENTFRIALTCYYLHAAADLPGLCIGRYHMYIYVIHEKNKVIHHFINKFSIVNNIFMINEITIFIDTITIVFE